MSSKHHAVIGETLRVSTFFAQFVRDRYEFQELAETAADSRVEWAADVLAEWNSRAERRGRPPANVIEARAILGVESEADKRRAGSADQISFETVEAAVALEESLIALMVMASRIERIGEAAGRLADGDRMAQAETVLAGLAERAGDELEAAKNVAGVELWRAWLHNDGKSYLDGLAAARRANRGTAWTKSRKGYATTIRYDETAEFAPTVKRHAAQVGQIVDEDALLEAALALD